MPRPSIAPPMLAVLAVALLVEAAAAFTATESKMPMTVTLVRSDGAHCGSDCPGWLALTGVIGPGTPALFSAALGRAGRRKVPVLVDSPGGSVEAAMAIGRMVRAHGMTVAVAGTAVTDCAPADAACAARRRAGERPGFVAGGTAACASACVLILAAGTERSVGDHSYVGVHQMTARRTLTRVMNYFRIVRRMVNGRPVEVSRTLIDTKPISSRTTVGAASESTYSEVDRYLLGLGIAESIMPLMRSAPPSGVHWLTPSELASTRIATDTTDASTLVERAALAGRSAAAPLQASPRRPQPPASPGTPASPGSMALAAAALGDGRRAAGIVTWRIDGAGGNPRLVAAVDVPERHLRGTLTLVRDAAPGTPGGFLASTGFGPPEAIESGRVWAAQAPRFCDPSLCDLPFAVPPESDDGRGGRTFRTGPAAGDRFLSDLRDKDWISIPLSADGGQPGWLSLSIDKDIRAVVGDWEHLCCGLAPPTVALAGASRATLVADAAAGAGPSPEDGTVTWSLETQGARGGASALAGDIDAPHVKGSIHLDFGAASSDAVALTVTLHLERLSDGRPVSFVAGPPAFRDAKTGGDETLRAGLAQAGDTATMTVARADRRTALEGFRDRPWFAVPLRIAGRSPAVLLLNLNGGGRGAIDAWLDGMGSDERHPGAELCCGPGLPPPPASPRAVPPPLVGIPGGDVGYALRAAGHPGKETDGIATLSWSGLPAAGSSPPPSSTGAIFVGAANLHATVVAGPASGDAVELDLVLTPDASRFGPATGLAARLSGEPDKAVTVMPGLDPTHYGGAFRLLLARQDAVAGDARLGLDLSDATGRHLALSVPVDGPLAALLERPGAASLTGTPASSGAGAAASWTELPGLAAPQPGDPCLLGSVDVTGAGMILSLQVGLAPGDAMGGVAVTVQTSPDVARFGPVTDLAVEPVTASDGRLAMIGAASARRYGGFDVTLAPSAPLPEGATLAFDLSDARGRKLRVAVPMPDALAKLLGAAMRARA